MKYPDDYINKIICGDCLEVKLKEIISHDIFYCPYDILKGADKDDTDKCSQSILDLIAKEGISKSQNTE